MSIDKCESFNKKEFARRLSDIRSENYPRIQDFAFLLGLSSKQYAKYEKEDIQQTPSLEKFNMIVQLCQTSPGFLLQGIGPKYIDLRSARKLTDVMNLAFDIERPNYGMIIQMLIGLTENQLQLLIDLIPVIKNFDPKLNQITFDKLSDL